MIVAAASALRINKKDAGAVDLPDHKLTPEGDAYLTKVFEKYTLPGKDASGDANGQGVLDKHTAKFAAREVVAKWKGLSGADLDAFVDSNFEKAWHNFDTTHAGTIPVKQAYYWVRQVAGEASP